MADLKTQKKKKKKNNKDLWKQFDDEINKDKNSNIECIYSSTDNNYCTYCESILITTDEGFPLCSNNICGLMQTNIVDHTPEWRYYGGDDTSSGDPTRCGMPINPLLKESSFGCKVLVGNGSSYEMRKIRRYTDWLGMPYKEKSQYDEFQKITILGSQGGIPKIIIDEAIRYHKKISEQKTFRGLNRTGIIAASIYIACSLNKYPRTAKEIADIFNLDNTSATKGCKNATLIINDLETDTIRLDASTIKQLFDDTNYTLNDVRETKLVKPVALTLLPNEIKMIENTKERKEFFIQIILIWTARDRLAPFRFMKTIIGSFLCGFHNFHAEVSHWENCTRALVWTIYLNDIPKGEGETEFLYDKIRAQPREGMGCIFPAAWMYQHRGNPVHTHPKYITTGWYWYPEESPLT